ncbi:cadherin repeat domain-containing protein [Candidatus Woesearchaeota archaeon]|nr:cadherin repeat domain-containing protein [Candidatus Woesearchaeota archaeon]
MNRTAQITVFIILGIVVLFLAALLYYFTVSKQPVSELFLAAPPQQAIKSVMHKCLETQATAGLFLLGIQGGYIFPPEDALKAEFDTIAYGYDRGQDRLATIPEMELQLSSFINVALQRCANLTSGLAQQGYILRSIGAPSTNVTIAKDRVIFRSEFPVTFQVGDTEYTVRDYFAEIPIRLSHVRDITGAVVRKTQEDPDFVDMTFLTSFDVQARILPYSDDTLIYSFTDEQSAKLGNNAFIFLSATRLVINQAPILDAPSELRLKDGVEYTLAVTATDPENQTVRFFDDTILFNIDENTGIAVFTPEVPGEYNVTITALDSKDKPARKVITIIVEE